MACFIAMTPLFQMILQTLRPTSSDIMEMERVRRILKLTTDMVNAICLDDDLLSCEDWEDLLVLDENNSS